MEHPWLEFWNKTGETLGVAGVFSFLGSGFLLWVSPTAFTARSGLGVIIGGQLLQATATIFGIGYLNWHWAVAPILGLVSGLVGSFVLLAVIKVGRDKAETVVEAGLNKVTGKVMDPKS